MIGRLVDELARQWQAVLSAGNSRSLVERPSGDRWSVLEYGCHVRDVFVTFDARLDLMLTEEGPSLFNWDQDRAAIEGHYAGQDPAVVAEEVRGAGSQLARRFRSVEPGAWSRTGHRLDGVTFTVETFGRYLVHDPVHHLHDIGRPFDPTPESVG